MWVRVPPSQDHGGVRSGEVEQCVFTASRLMLPPACVHAGGHRAGLGPLCSVAFESPVMSVLGEDEAGVKRSY